MTSLPPSLGIVARWREHLGRRSPPHFNQLVVWALLASSALLACLPLATGTGERGGPTTVFSWLPDGVLASSAMFWLFRGLLIAGIALWALNRGLPWSCWLVTGGFTGLWSMHVENTTNTSHIFHMTNMLLVIQSIWYTADARQIKLALAERAYWTTPLVPRWVSLAAIAYIGLFHTAAGLSKLTYSGPGWASGTSLQLWTYLWGYSWSPTTQLIVGSRTFTRWLQIGTLVLETSGILALLPALRPWIGLGLLGFYAGVIATFDYGFELNALFTGLYFLPCERWISKRSGQIPLSKTT
ncbi:MAG: hypothetical protein WD872_20530 [Pirellulaceae bacterium]